MYLKLSGFKKITGDRRVFDILVEFGELFWRI